MNITQALLPSEMQACADIWLEASIAAHTFIPHDFWRDNHVAMREQYLPAADVYLAQEQGIIVGFAALHQGTLAALFVLPAWWSKGVGSLLLQHVQGLHAELKLTVYAKNSRAINFYLRHGFITQQEQTCAHTSEPELQMLWNRKNQEVY